MGFAARVALLFALVLATLGASRNDGDVVRLLERMRNASGPVWQTHFVSVSRLTLGAQQNVVSSESQGLRITVRHCTGELCNGTYFDGAHLYSVNMNGTTLARSLEPEPFLRSLRLVASLEFLSPAFIARGGRLGGAGNATFDGKPYRTIVVGDVNSVPLRLYVDPQTALIRLAREVDGSETFEYRNYRRIDGVTVPFLVLHDGQIFERYDDRAAVSSAFYPPHGPTPSFRGSPQAIPTDPRAVTPIADCSIGGVSVRCLLDTGNSGLSMSSELASRIGAPVVGTYQIRGLGGYTTQVVRAGPLRIGNAAYSDAYYAVLNDLRRYGYDVVLGADVLGSTVVEVDGGAHVIRLGAAPARSAIALPVTFENFIPVVSVGLGSIETELAVDTGDESNINLAYDFYVKHPGLFSITQRRSVSGIGGNSVEMIGEIPQVRIGDYRTGSQRIGTTQTLQGTAFGHLGAAFLQQFVVQFDYGAATLRLTPRT
ncbi:MAG TPA: retropepsin-like aspartic protease [Candidatus Dormibacteraeota bacterium]|nr:retropepsin-like aspartic protease [Candidatus Dormibacteraeota bacterium]